MSYSPPDSLQKHRFWSPANGTWINFTNDTLEVGPHDTLYKEVKLKSDATGIFQTYFNRYREFRSFPARAKIVFKVQNVSATEEESDLSPSITPPFPNPTSDLISFPVQSAVTDAARVEIFDWSGRLVYATDFQRIGPDEQMPSCHIGQLPNGNYLYKVLFQRDGTLTPTLATGSV